MGNKARTTGDLVIDARQIVESIDANEEVAAALKLIIDRSATLTSDAFDIFGDGKPGSTSEFQAAHVHAQHAQVVVQDKHLGRIAAAMERSAAAQESMAMSLKIIAQGGQRG